jgi:hypothetical protein
MGEVSVEFLILGQGFSACAMAFELEKFNKSYMIIDDPESDSSSKNAVGLVNPVTGRRMAKTWNWDEINPIATEFYKRTFEIIFGKKGTFLIPKPIYKALFSIEETNFLTIKSAGIGYEKLLETYLIDQKPFPLIFKDVISWTEIKKGGRLDPIFYLDSCTSFFERNKKIKFETFQKEDLLKTSGAWVYKNIKALNVVSCLGLNCPWIGKDFWPNKGQVYEVEGFPNWGDEVLKTDIFVVPLENGNHLMGSTYEREFEHNLPDEAGWKAITKDISSEYLKGLKIIKSWAGFRPTNAERRPFIDKLEDNLFAINGLGTKGVSLSPYAANFLLKMIFSTETDAEFIK